jgi:ribosomal protein S12 methylthiotransferase
VGEYGSELYGKRMLPELLERLEKIEGIRWIRLLYIYPETISEELIDVMSASEKILHYIDMPLQHVNDRILRMMGRRTDRKEIEGIIKSLRDRMDDIIIRSTFITGFPTETDEEHEELLEFIRSARLDRVGFFTYSREEGTPAYYFEPQIEEDKKEERFDELMSAQEEVSIENLERFAGKTLEVIIEDRVEDGVYIGRSYMDTPDIDGEVYLESDDELEIGNIYKVLITDTLEYDLVGRKI